MNDPNWNAKAFEHLTARLRSMGAEARLPHGGEGPDAYVASLMGWMLDVTQASQNAKAQAYWNTPVGNPGAPRDRNVLIDRDAAKLIRGERLVEGTEFHDSEFHPKIETPKTHVIEASGRSYKIEAAIVDGKSVKPGEPMPPKDET